MHENGLDQRAVSGNGHKWMYREEHMAVLPH